MKKLTLALLSILLTFSANAQFGGLLKKKSSDSGVSKEQFVDQGNELVTKYLIIMNGFQGVLDAQGNALGLQKKAAESKAATDAASKDSNAKNLEKAEQLQKELGEEIAKKASETNEISEEAKKNLQATLPKAALSLAGGTLLIKDSVDWFKGSVDQFKSAGFLGAAKLKKELGGAIFVAKGLAKNYPRMLKSTKDAFGFAKKMGCKELDDPTKSFE